MRVEIVKPVAFRGEVKRSGVVDAPEHVAKHWLATGAAKSAEVNPPATAPAAAAERGQKRF